MKILHIVPSYWPAYRHGGPVKSVHFLNKWLVKLGVDVTVYTTNINGRGLLDVPLSKPVTVDGVRVFYFPLSFRPWKYSIELDRELSKTAGDFDLIHITSVFLSASIRGSHYARKFNKPYVISPRGSLMREPMQRKSAFLKRLYVSLVEKKNLALASAVHFTSALEEKEYREAGLHAKKSFVIPNSFDEEEFLMEKNVARGEFRKKFGIGENAPLALFLGRLNWKKGFDTLIPAFSAVLKEIPDAVLLIAGGDDENYRKEIERMIDANGIRGKVIFAGEVLGGDKVSALTDADCFVLPSYSENFGMAVVEALYFSLPVVLTREVAVSDEVLKEKAGLVIDKNEQELAGAMVKLLMDKKSAAQMGRRGREMVLERFSPLKVAEKFRETYKSLING